MEQSNMQKRSSLANNNIIANNKDVIVAVLVVAIILMIIIPLKEWMLDFFLALNMTVSFVIFFITLFTTNVLQLSVFPTLLLITTLFRLALNISTTRSILTEAKAGGIIQSFADIVIQGNYAVGIIIFLIIVLVQFMVITAGAGRVSEVSARFTLDAMPGKQMSIDADLNSGVITEQEAIQRRLDLQHEADFYGAMDGASKFVKGDAVAGLIVTVINILGGIIIGVVMLKMDIISALETYANLTVGDGLVSQIPALLISTASGILVTRSGNGNSNFGEQLVGQLTAFPKVIAITGGVLLVLGIFLVRILILFAVICFVLAYLLYKEDKEQIIKEIEEQEQEIVETEKREPENVATLTNVEAIEIELGYGLLPLADETTGGDLLQRIASVRRQCAIELGIVLKPIRIRDNLQIETNEYIVRIRGSIIARGEVMASMLLCMDPTNMETEIAGIRTIEPTFGLPAVWINKDQREDAEIKGLTVVDPTTVMVTHLTETIKGHAYELLGRQEVKELIDVAKENYSAVVEELIPDLMTLGEVQKVLKSLLQEKVPIKDMVTILETLADYSRTTKDTEMLTEYARMALARIICQGVINNEDNSIIVVTVDPSIEEVVANNIQKSIQGSFPALDPDTTGKILASLQQVIGNTFFYENQPIVLVSPKIRPAFRKLTEMVFPNLMVLSLNEIPNNVEIKAEGTVVVQ